MPAPPSEQQQQPKRLRPYPTARASVDTLWPFPPPSLSFPTPRRGTTNCAHGARHERRATVPRDFTATAEVWGWIKERRIHRGSFRLLRDSPPKSPTKPMHRCARAIRHNQRQSGRNATSSAWCEQKKPSAMCGRESYKNRRRK
ncbi:hypothetical protein TRVL_08038 [Trypanosoma vivax]|nr:hypothetical protein TRVL_08038 [Trypanosoma vivax]